MSNANIMVVEDSGVVLLDIQKSLGLFGYTVVATASSKDEAIRKADETRPDLILMDIRLGDDNGGIDAANYIREHFNIPIIFLTGYADEDTFRRAKITNPFGYILKPFDPNSLHTTIEIALHNHELKSRLRESEERYRTLVETMNDGVAQADANGKIIYVNDKLCEMTGFSSEELTGREHTSLFVDEFRDLQRKEFANRRSGVASSFETALMCQDGSSIPVLLSGSPLLDQDGSFAGAIGVFTDITERKQVESELKESEERFRTIFDTEPECVKILKPDTTLVTMNPAGLAMIEAESLDMVKGQSVLPIIDDAFRNDFRKLTDDVCKKGQSGMLEFRITGLKGTPRWLETHAVPLLDPEMEVTGLLGVTRDITKQKHVEAALQESESLYHDLVETAQDLIWQCDQDGRYVYLNPAWEDTFGYKVEEMLGKTFAEFQSPEYAKRDFGEYKNILRGNSVKGFETVHFGKNGRQIHLVFNAKAVCDEHGNVLGTRGTAYDITERKQAEEALLESEERMRRLASATHEGIVFTEEGKVVEANEQLARMLGCELSELIGKSVIDYVAPESRSLVMEKVRSGYEKPYEHLAIKKDGTIFPIEVQARMLESEGREVRVSAIRDISERKQAEEKFRVVFESAPDAHFIYDLKGRFVDGNKTAERIMGYKKDELMGESFLKIGVLPKDQLPQAAAALAKNRLGKPSGPDEYTLIRKDKNKVDVEIITHPVIIDGESLVLGTARNITERKKSQQAIQEREAKLQSIFRAAPIGIGMTIDRVIQEANQMLCQMTGYSRDELVGQNARILYLSTEDYEYVGDAKYRMIQEWGIGTVETRWKRKNGDIRDILLSSVPLDLSDISKGVTFSALDITERMQAESAVKESEERYRNIVESSLMGMHMYELHASDELVFSGSNPAADEILGVDNALFVGKTIEDAFPALVDTEVPERYKSAAKNGDSWKTEQIEYDSDGIKGAFEVVAFQTSPNNMVAMFQDITTRKRAEETLRVKTAELEALFSISAHLRTAQSADEMLPVVVAEMRRVLQSDANAVILLDADEEHFTYTLSDGSLNVNNGMQFSVENSISGMVLDTREPYITDDLSSDTRKTTAIQGDDNLGPAVLVPVISETEFLGVLLCARNKGSDSRPFAPSDVQLLKAIGEMVGNAFRRATLYDQAMTRLQHVQALHSIDMAISANLDLSVILDVLLTQGAAQLDVDAASLLLLNPHTHMLEYAVSSGFRKKDITSARLRLGEGLPGQVAMDRNVLSLPDLTHADNLVRKYLLDEGFVSYQAAPLTAKGQLQGVLEIFNRKAMAVSEEQTSFLETLATQAAIAIENSQLFSDLQRSNFELEMAYDATIEGWSRALELRDQETEGHTLRVAEITLRLAQMMGIRGEELIQVRRGALLHDIGKMGVPDRILLKPGRLDDDEWEIMRQHTVYAFEMLWPIEFLRPAVDIPHCHHERWDGTGYPRGLKGEHIPLAARIFAVVDVWDALNSDRSYRKAWTEEKALDYITTNVGKHFDPQVVEQFLNFLNNNDQS